MYSKTNSRLVKTKEIKPPPILSMCVVFILTLQSLTRPLKVISRDDKLKAEVGVREAKDLILNQKVHWIQGTVSSAVALAVSAYCKGQEVIFIDTVAQSAATTGERDIAMSFGLPPTPQPTPVVWPMPWPDSGQAARRSSLSVLTMNTGTGAMRIL